MERLLHHFLRLIQVEREDKTEYSLNHIEVTKWSRKDPIHIRRVSQKVKMLEKGIILRLNNEKNYSSLPKSLWDLYWFTVVTALASPASSWLPTRRSRIVRTLQLLSWIFIKL